MVSCGEGIPNKEQIKGQDIDMIETAWERVVHSTGTD